MALYATDDDEVIHAWDAKRGSVYRCLECGGPVKVRKKGKRFPHFYHIKTSPSCRLYSKSEDHLLLQWQLQKNVSPQNVQMEKPLVAIHRVADLLWEEKKIVFEIQCSLLQEIEAAARIKEYGQAGYEVIWILDDRVFNKTSLRPAEQFLRSRTTYFASVGRSTPSFFYDQFEIFYEGKRIKKGPKIALELKKMHPLPLHAWPAALPSCIERRIPHARWFCERDLIHRALGAHRHPFLNNSLQNWCALEKHLTTPMKNKASRIKNLWRKWVRDPYLAWIDALLRRVSSGNKEWDE